MTEQLLAIGLATWDMYLDAAFWLLVGVLGAGVLHAWLPAGILGKWLGGQGFVSVVKAAFVGAPLPLCSCGVLPAGVGLRKDGASKGATVSFLIATPETGPDSVALSYALLGPIMAIVRPVAAVVSAIISGLLTNFLVRGEREIAPPPEAPPTCSSNSCCDASCGGDDNPKNNSKLLQSLHYGFVDVLDDIALWLVVGLVLAGVMAALVEPQALGDFGSGFGAMVVMVIVGVPIYVCATASTPIAAGMIAAGVSPGAALVFLLVGPATNIATLGVVGRELGLRALAGYLIGIVVSAITIGLMTDYGLALASIDIAVQMTDAGETLPDALKWLAGGVLLPFMALSLLRDIKSRMRR